MALRLPAFASGPSARRNTKIIGGSVVVALGLAYGVYLMQPAPPRRSNLPRVYPNGEQFGMSGSNERQRELQTEHDNAAAEQARETHTTHLASYSNSFAIEGREERHRTARNVHPAITSRPIQIDPSMVAGYLAAMNRAMGASVPVAERIEIDGEKLAKERAELLEASLKRRQAEAEHSPEKPFKPGLGLAGRRVMGHTVLANTVDADTSGSRNMPVLVQMDTGPLAGYRLEGSIEKHEDSLSVPINTLFGPDGRKIPVDALLVSPQTQETTVACDVNHHYFARIGVPALVGAVQGLGQAALLSGLDLRRQPVWFVRQLSQLQSRADRGHGGGRCRERRAGCASGCAAEGIDHRALPGRPGRNLFPVGCFVGLTIGGRHETTPHSRPLIRHSASESNRRGLPMTSSAMADVQPLRARPHVSLPLQDAAAPPASETVAKPDQTSDRRTPNGKSGPAPARQAPLCAPECPDGHGRRRRRRGGLPERRARSQGGARSDR